jgi:hypothetical protein
VFVQRRSLECTMALTCNEAALDQLLMRVAVDTQCLEHDTLAALLADHIARQFDPVLHEVLIQRSTAEAIAAAYRDLDPKLVVSFAGRSGERAQQRLISIWDEFGTEMQQKVLQCLKGTWKPPQRLRGAVRARPPKYRRDAAARLAQPSVVKVLCQTPAPTAYDGESLGARYRALLTRPLKIAGAPEEGALARLAQRFPWMKAAVLEVSTAIALARRLESSRIIVPPILLHGPPGIGKTRFCVELGAALGRGVLLQPMSALHEGFTISGSSRTYHQPDASLVVRAMYQHRCADPIIVLDELDKAGRSDWNGNAQSALLTWMEPTTAHMALDVFLDSAIDATHVAWIATANDVRGVARPLLSRFRRIDVQPPGSDYIDVILQGFAHALAARFRIDSSRVPSVSARTRAALLRTLEAKGDLREVEAQWQHAIARQELHLVEPPVS